MTWSGSWLREAWKARKLSQTALGEKVGATQAQVSQWEIQRYLPFL